VATIISSDVIDGVVVVEPDIHGDERGIFIETYRRQWFPSGREMIQGNRGDRRAGAIVGLHYHLHQADYWYVPYGRARVVLHDLRVGSATDGATLTIDLESQEIRGPDGGVVKFDLDPFRKHCLINGLDDIGLTMEKKASIDTYEDKLKRERAWA